MIDIFKNNKNQIYNYSFQPTISLFDKSIVYCYQKVGTRFFLFLSNWPKTINETYNQYQINFSLNESSENRLKINTEFNSYTSTIEFIEEHKNSYDSYDSFLSYSGVDTINDFVLNNHKDSYFIIRNPVKRFLSGIPQIVGQYVSELLVTSEERDRIKSHIDITDDEINKICNNYNDFFNENEEFTQKNLEIVDIDIFIKITLYVLKYMPNRYYYDAHTQNYLSKYKELIYNFKDKDKAKILDLDDCKKDSAFRLFNTWNDNVDYFDAKFNMKGHQISNKKLYRYLDFILDDKHELSESIFNFLIPEIKEYNELKSSKYFIKL